MYSSVVPIVNYIISYPYQDIIKNTALAHMRLYEFLQLVPKLEGRILNIPKTTFDDRNKISHRTERVVKEYLTYNIDTTVKPLLDRDYQVFQSFYNTLLSRNESFKAN